MAETFALHNGLLIDGTGADPLPGATVLVEGNPLENIDLLRNKDNVRLVMKEGTILKDRLDAGQPDATGSYSKRLSEKPCSPFDRLRVSGFDPSHVSAHGEPVEP